uniref:Uncharacterized protein n=1 Tax=Anopheles farauti TaxID=69004 RepID=A0A182QDA9_9DIPT
MHYGKPINYRGEKLPKCQLIQRWYIVGQREIRSVYRRRTVVLQHTAFTQHQHRAGEGETMMLLMTKGTMITATIRTKTAMGTGLVDKTLLNASFHSFLVFPTVFFVELRGH